MAPGFSDSLFVRTVNTLAVGLRNAPLVGRLVGRGLVVIRYVGTAFGQDVRDPGAVAFRRNGIPG